MNLGPITKEEIKKAAQKIKTGKAPGPNNISLEAMKSDLGTTADIKVDLLKEALEKEEIPAE